MWFRWDIPIVLGIAVCDNSLFPKYAAIASPKTLKRQGFPQSRQFPCLPGLTVLPAVGEIPTPWRFLSISYFILRIFAIYGSLAT
jgi:hypothetical protein